MIQRYYFQHRGPFGNQEQEGVDDGNEVSRLLGELLLLVGRDAQPDCMFEKRKKREREEGGQQGMAGRRRRKEGKEGKLSSKEKTYACRC